MKEQQDKMEKQNQSIVKYKNILTRNGVDTSILDFIYKGISIVIYRKDNPSIQFSSIKWNDIVDGMDGETICLSIYDTNKPVKDGYVDGGEFYSTDKNYLKKSVELVKKYLAD